MMLVRLTRLAVRIENRDHQEHQDQITRNRRQFLEELRVPALHRKLLEKNRFESWGEQASGKCDQSSPGEHGNESDELPASSFPMMR